MLWRTKYLAFASLLATLFIVGCGGESEPDVPLIRTASEFNTVNKEAQAIAEPIFLRVREPDELTVADKVKLERAVALFEGLIGFQSDLYLPFMGSGRGHFLLGKNKLAIDRLRRCIQLAPVDSPEGKATAAEAYYLGSKIYEAEPDYTSAEEAAKQAVKLIEISPDYWAQLASCEVQLNKLKEARSHIQEALKLDPNNTRAVGLEKLLDVAEGAKAKG